MTKSRLPTLPGHDTLLYEQALEMANLRAARDGRRANLQLAQERVQQLTGDDTEFFRGVSTPDRDVGQRSEPVNLRFKDER